MEIRLAARPLAASVSVALIATPALAETHIEFGPERYVIPDALVFGG